MEYHTPGVYIREVDSGPKPIASVATSIPGFIGLFEYAPAADAIAITGSDGTRQLRGKVMPQLVDSKGAITGDAAEATTALTQAFRLKRGQVKDVKAYLNLHGAAKSGAKAPKFEPGTKGRVKISLDAKSVEVADVMDVKGKVVTDNDRFVEELLNTFDETFSLEKVEAKTGRTLAVYGFDFEGAEGNALRSEYSVPPMAVTNKAEFFRWPQITSRSTATEPVEELVGMDIEDPDDAGCRVRGTRQGRGPQGRFREDELASVFNFVLNNGFYDNGGGKSYVYLMGVQNMTSIRENQADKVGLGFDDVDDMALMCAWTEQRAAEGNARAPWTRKDCFAISMVPRLRRRHGHPGGEGLVRCTCPG